MADDRAPGRPSRPDEEPPRRRGGRFARVVGTAPGVITLALLLVALAVVLIVLLA